MSNQTITYVVAAGSATLGMAAYIGFVLVPAMRAYSGVWQRLAAGFLSLYVVAAALLLGVGGGAAVVWFWQRYAL